MKTKKRFYKTIYFPCRDENGKNIVKNISVAFNSTNELELYNEVKKISTTEIKKMIGIFSYPQLVKTADRVNRKITELIKMRLREKLIHKADEVTRTVTVSRRQLKKWRKTVATLDDTEVADELKHFLDIFK